MADTFTRKARLRKLVYTVLILFLFTGSLLHRKFLLEPQAFSLQLREQARGDVDLTSSAVSLLLTGSRGLAVTILWSMAIHEQQLHRWNEVELLVKSITKLQPHFITPWLFQSWNVSFNIAVECDRPRDKYYYVSRGIELLAEGERRNRGAGDELRLAEEAAETGKRARFPGNPDMRQHLGFTYQLKIGASDEKTTMQCLLDLSCIDPVQRDYHRFLGPGERRRQEIKEEAFHTFCQQHPRLVRRLREVLGYHEPSLIIGFLKDNGKVPSRFDKPRFTGLAEPPPTPLKHPREQFPILPPKILPDWPDPNTQHLSSESVDVFLVSRTWYQYSQLPLPPEKSDPDLKDPRFRKPRHMMLVLFRGYPSHAQRFAAEALSAEGFFDEDGWLIKDWHTWFQDRRDGPKGDRYRLVRVGTEPKYHAGPAWNKTYQAYRDYGERTAQFMAPAVKKHLENLAHLYRSRFKVQPLEVKPLPEKENQGDMARSYQAHLKLNENAGIRHLTNYDNHLYTAHTERQPMTILARKLSFHAERYRKVVQDPSQALVLYEEAWPIWLDVLLANPEYRRLNTAQEDVCDLQLKYCYRLIQEVYANDLLRPLLLGQAKFAAWPHDKLDKLLTDNDRLNILPIRDFRTPFEMVLVYDGPYAEELQDFLLAWTTGPLLAQSKAFPGVVVMPGQKERLLTASAFPGGSHHPDWKPLVVDHTVRLVRDRLSLPKTIPSPPGSVTPPPK